MSELSDEARALLVQVRSDQLDEPSADDRARLRARLAATLALSTLGGTAASAALPKTAAAQLASAGLSTKLVLASLVVATAGAAAFGMRRNAESVAPSRVAAPASAPLAAPAARAALEPSDVVQEPAAAAAHDTGDDADSSALVPVRKGAARRAQVESSTQPAPPPSLQAELALITAAQEALRAGRPQLAQRRAAEHATRFPQGALVQERLGIDAIAACALGERARGLSALKKLARRAPNAPLLVRARAACREPDAE